MIRVSDVLSYHPAPFLVAWEKKKGWAFCKKVRDEALEVGSAVDMAIQRDINGAEVGNIEMDKTTHPEFYRCMKAWENFKSSEDGKVFYANAVNHKENMQKELVLGDLIGHPDFIFSDELPDLKTSKSISISHWIQAAQYAKMAGHSSYDTYQVKTGDIKKISIIRLDKYDEAGRYEYKTLEEPFISLLQGMFQIRYEGMVNDILRRQDYGKDLYEHEEKSFAELMRKKMEKERLA